MTITMVVIKQAKATKAVNTPRAIMPPGNLEKKQWFLPVTIVVLNVLLLNLQLYNFKNLLTQLFIFTQVLFGIIAENFVVNFAPHFLGHRTFQFI
jgi:hypothetical protein